MKEVGKVEVSEEALAEGLLHHLRRMKKPKDSLARVKDGLNNRLGVNPSGLSPGRARVLQPDRLGGGREGRPYFGPTW